METLAGLLLILYFVPIFIARSRKTGHLGGIAAVNVFLGWTVLGWLAALIWACTEKAET